MWYGMVYVIPNFKGRTNEITLTRATCFYIKTPVCALFKVITFNPMNGEKKIQ